MKIVITGSLGNISRPLTISLVEAGHSVVVISSKQDRATEIESIGAMPAIGTLEDTEFLATAFQEADVVYCMIPPNYYGEPDLIAYYRRIAGNYANAIVRSGVKRVIHLSSMGAELEKGTGIIVGSHFSEQILNNIPGITVTHIRATYFYYNLNNFIDTIRNTGMIISNCGGDDRIVVVSPIDIAAAISDEILNKEVVSNIRYVASEELTADEIAGIIGSAIGKPGMKWMRIPDEEMQKTFEGHGVPTSLATLLVEMSAALHNGDLLRNYYPNRPEKLGNIKLKEFAAQFADTYNKK